MDKKTNNPSQQTLSEYLAARRRSGKPPPTPEEIRRQLGWNMLHPTKTDTMIR